MVETRKKALRAALRDQLQLIDAATLRERSAEACRRFIEMTIFDRSDVVMLYLPLGYEIDPSAIALRAWQLGKTVAVPLVNWEQKHMIPVELKSLSEEMHETRYGVKAPASSTPIPPRLVDIIAVPGLAFDTQGHRLGRGGGFYDRFLSQDEFRGAAVGLGLDQQVVAEVPTTDLDFTLDTIVTDQRMTIIRNRSRHFR